jgi:hypothetical protein
MGLKVLQNLLENRAVPLDRRDVGVTPQVEIAFLFLAVTLVTVLAEKWFDLRLISDLR